jgi:hypothetical protein
MTDIRLRKVLAASTLNATQRSTLTSMADGMCRNTLEIRIGMDRLAALIGVKRRATINRVRDLERLGVLEPSRRGGGRSESGRGYVNAWRLNLAALTPNRRDATDCTLNGAMGAVDCTVKSAVDRHQGCSGATGRVQPNAPDKKNQNSQKKKKKANPSPSPSKGGEALAQREESRPWINPEAPRADREANQRRKLRMQADALEAAQRRVGDGTQLHKADSSGKGESGSTPTGETGR